MTNNIITNKNSFLKAAHEYRPRFIKIANSKLYDIELARDVVSDAILKASDRREQLQNPDRLYSWMSRIIINSCYDLLRKRKKEILTQITEKFADQKEDQQNQPGVKVDLVTTIEEILDAIIAIRPHEHRKMLMLYYYHKLDYNQISRHENIPYGTVKSRLSRARESLQKELRRRGVHEADLEDVQDLGQWPAIILEEE